jgi:hypothetical protein
LLNLLLKLVPKCRQSHPLRRLPHWLKARHKRCRKCPGRSLLLLQQNLPLSGHHPHPNSPCRHYPARFLRRRHPQKGRQSPYHRRQEQPCLRLVPLKRRQCLNCLIHEKRGVPLVGKHAKRGKLLMATAPKLLTAIAHR